MYGWQILYQNLEAMDVVAEVLGYRFRSRTVRTDISYRSHCRTSVPLHPGCGEESHTAIGIITVANVATKHLCCNKSVPHILCRGLQGTMSVLAALNLAYAPCSYSAPRRYAPCNCLVVLEWFFETSLAAYLGIRGQRLRNGIDEALG